MMRSRKIWTVTTARDTSPVAWTSPKPTVAMVDIVKYRASTRLCNPVN